MSFRRLSDGSGGVPRVAGRAAGRNTPGGLPLPRAFLTGKYCGRPILYGFQSLLSGGVLRNTEP